MNTLVNVEQSPKLEPQIKSTKVLRIFHCAFCVREHFMFVFEIEIQGFSRDICTFRTFLQIPKKVFKQTTNNCNERFWNEVNYPRTKQ